jgi:hypothetical protein
MRRLHRRREDRDEQDNGGESTRARRSSSRQRRGPLHDGYRRKRRMDWLKTRALRPRVKVRVTVTFGICIATFDRSNSHTGVSPSTPFTHECTDRVANCQMEVG